MKYKIEGLPVTKIYYSGQIPAISNGIFKIANDTMEKVCTENIEIRIITSQKELPIKEFYIYQIPEYNEIPKSALCIEAHSAIKVDISFPFVYEFAMPFNDIRIGLTLFIDTKKFTAYSAVEIVTRVSLP